MDTPMTQYQFRAGDDVIAADGDKLGTLAAFTGQYLVVEKGFFFPKEYYIPASTISNYDAGERKIYLAVTKDAALNSGWDMVPADYEDAAYVDARGGANIVDTDTRLDAFDTGVRDTYATDQDHISVPVHEEELIPTKTVRQAGQVRVDKDVIEEEREIDVPVTEERVKVTRRAVDQVADTGDMAFREESFEVPVRTEDVGVDKVVRVAEQVDIDKQAIQDTKRVSGTVRKERVDVDEAGTDASIYADTNRVTDESAST